MECGNDYVNFMFYGIALGYGPAHMRSSRCQLEVLFTRKGPVHKYNVEGPLHACSVHMYNSCSLWAVTVNWEIVEIYISLFWDRILDSHSYCVLSVDQAFCESLYLFDISIKLFGPAARQTKHQCGLNRLDFDSEKRLFMTIAIHFKVVPATEIYFL